MLHPISTYPLRIELAKHELDKVLIFDSDNAVGLAISIWSIVDATICVGLVFGSYNANKQIR